MSTKTLIPTLAALFVLLSAIFAATHDFIPDFAFKDRRSPAGIPSVPQRGARRMGRSSRWKGLYVAVTGESGSHDLTLNADGTETKRAPLLSATAQFARMAAGPWTNGSVQVPGFAKLAITLAEQQAEAASPAAAPTGSRGAVEADSPRVPNSSPAIGRRSTSS